VVLPVLVYDWTGSPALSSLLAAVEALPYLALGLLAGAVAGRFPRRRTMIGCDLACAVLMGSIRRKFEVFDGSADRRLALAGMLEGLRFIWRSPLLRAMLLG
jgi:MFS family permease